MADKEFKCDEHSGVCATVKYLKEESTRKWKAIDQINQKLWLILVLAASGAIGTLINLVIQHNGHNGPK